MENRSSGERMVWLDILRVLSLFFVVMVHAAQAHKEMIPALTPAWNAVSFYGGISRFCVPVFVMISGTLFLDRDIPLRTLYGKYILRIVLAFAAWSFLYACAANIPAWRGLRSFLALFVKGEYHLWYLYMIAGLYMVTPFLRRLVQDRRLTLYFLGLSLVFAVAVPQAVGMIRLRDPALGAWAAGVADQGHLHLVLGFPLYYVGGYCLAKADIGKKAFLLLCALGAAGFVSTVLLSLPSLEHRLLYTGEFTLNVAAEAVFVFVLFRRLFAGRSFSPRARRVWAVLAKYTFGAYLVHALVLRALSAAGFHNLTFAPLLAIPAVTAVTYGISYGLSAVLNRIPWVKTHLV